MSEQITRRGFVLLAQRGFNDEDIGRILGGNCIRIWKKILPA